MLALRVVEVDSSIDIANVGWEMSRVCRVDGPLVCLATNPDPLYGENMATAEKVIGYEFYRGFYADSENRRVLKNKDSLRIPLTRKEYDVLEFFLKNPKKLIAREAVQPLDKTVGRHPVDNYLSRIASKLGLKTEELFKPTRGVAMR
jgi:hypothetical protein